jgi:hypothetical protein
MLTGFDSAVNMPTLILFFQHCPNTRCSDGHIFGFTLNANEAEALCQRSDACATTAQEWIKYNTTRRRYKAAQVAHQVSRLTS